MPFPAPELFYDRSPGRKGTQNFSKCENFCSTALAASSRSKSPAAVRKWLGYETALAYAIWRIIQAWGERAELTINGVPE
jgi:hypothetical protein